MTNKKINDRVVVKISCGSSIGTAFFVTKDLLLTARHNIDESVVNEEAVAIVIEQSSYAAEVLYQDSDNMRDFAVIRVREYECESSLLCLAMPIKEGDSYSFMGYPQTILGQIAGSTVDVKIHSQRDTFYVGEGFDCTATINGSFMPTQFTGFSGSPIYNEEELVVGIITHKLDGCVGFVSIQKVVDTLQAQNIPVELDHEKYDNSPYSVLTNRKILDKSISMAGPRYMRDIHVPTDELDKYFEFAVEASAMKSKVNSYSESISKIEKLLEKALLPIWDVDGANIKMYYLQSLKEFREHGLSSGLNHWMELLNHNIGTLKNEIGKVRSNSDYDSEVLIAQWNPLYKSQSEIFRELESHYYLVEKPYLTITGKAGSGKTHLLCHIAEKYSSLTNVYLCFGHQFNGHEEIGEQLQRIFGFGSSSYLKELNEKSIERRALFIIDALNEGVGYRLWESQLGLFLDQIKEYPNIALVVSVRDTFLTSLHLSNDFAKISHIGHNDIEKAKNIYFQHYLIKKNEIPFKTPEFRNPLFLKIFCETFNQLNPYERTQINKLGILFIFYISNRERFIAEMIDFDPHLSAIRHFIDDMALLSLKCNNNELRLNDISRVDAHAISNSIAPNRTWRKSLLYWMIEENILINSINNNLPYKERDRIAFAYERMGDVFKAISFLVLEEEEQKNEILNQIVKVNNPQAANFMVALSSLVPDWSEGEQEIFDLYPAHFEKSVLMKTAFIQSLDFRGVKSHNVVQVLKDKVFKTVDDKLFFGAFFNNIFISESQLNADLLHRLLVQLNFAELNQRWTHTINLLYDQNSQNIEQYYSIDEIRNVEKQSPEELYNYLVYLCWFLSSSYPVIRDRVTRVITYLLSKHNSLATKLIEQFKDVKDLYVLERLLCAVYGAVLLSRDNNFIKEIANSVVTSIFKNGIVPPHIHLRHYARLIVERAHCLDLIDSSEYKESCPPYKSDVTTLEEIDEEAIKEFGTTDGTNKMLYSIGVGKIDHYIASDFYRYILGGNSREYSCFLKIGGSELTTLREEDCYTTYELAKIIGNEVRLLGWSDTVGQLDDNRYSGNRHENKRERIGKKFQWLGLYSAIAKLVDNTQIYDKWRRETIRYDTPFDINYRDYFDPTLEIPGLSRPIDADFKLHITRQEFNPEENHEEWFTSEKDKLVVSNFVVADDRGDKWVRISGLDIWESGAVPKKELFYRYDTYLIDNVQLLDFNRWASRQNFYGKWMPMIEDKTSFRLFEYPWCSTYKNEEISWSFKVLNACPCEVVPTIMTQLQEDGRGLLINDRSSFSTAIPNEDLFKSLELYFSRQRGLILDSNHNPAVVDATYLDDHFNGLYIRQDLLDEYLESKNKALVMTILGSKSIIAPMHIGDSRDITGNYYYESNSGYTGDMRIVGNSRS